MGKFNACSMDKGDGLEIWSQVVDHSWPQQIFLESIAFSKASVCPTLPARVFVVFDKVFPQTAKLIFGLRDELPSHLPWSDGTVF